MTERYSRYSRRKFKQWKDRVRGHLPQFTIRLYSAKLNGQCVPNVKEKLLGLVIEAINNPSYAITDCFGKPLDAETATVDEVILELHVNELFAFIKQLPPIDTKRPNTI